VWNRVFIALAKKVGLGLRSQAEKRVCPLPFSRIQLFDSGGYMPCNHQFLREGYFKLKTDEDLWNGRQAQALRNSFYDGSKRFCKLEYCNQKLVGENELEAVSQVYGISEANIEAVRQKNPILPEGPGSVNIAVDPRCNLACAICRPEKIELLDDDKRFDIAVAEKYLHANRESIRILVVGRDGEPLFSPYLRQLVKEATAKKFPKLLSIELITNGLLFNSETYQELRPGAERIDRKSVV
jgi:sulfatase maturation enzyme AslB (radical SAM superfamily)